MLQDWRRKGRAWLVLGRVSNLPTVWSNCLCGWLLGGGGSPWTLGAMGLGATLMYVGGMYWNDAFDARFDRQHRRERPIPSGQVTEAFVWRAGGWLLGLGGGVMVLAGSGWGTVVLSLLLLGCIVVYDAIHKLVAFSPLIMAGCRFLLLLAAASSGAEGVTGMAVWAALALAGWIVGLSYVARRESAQGTIAWWPLGALALPVGLSGLVNDGDLRWRGLVLSAGLVAWALWCLKSAWRVEHRNLGRTVSGLLAGICLVDWLAAPTLGWGGLVFAGLFVLALATQRYVPAT